MSGDKNLYCYAVKHGLAFSSLGFLKPCCNALSSKIKLKDLDSLDAYYKSSYLERIQSSMEKGELPDSCNQCAKSEEMGATSLRQIYNERFKGFEEYGSFDSPVELRFLEVNFSNVCNLSCSFCNSIQSSKWIELDAKLVDSSLRDENEVTKRIETLDHWGYEQWSEFFSTRKSLRNVIVKGGEPLIAPQLPAFLKAFSEQFDSHTRLRIVTNGTVLSEEVLDLLGRIPSLYFGVSIDGVDDVYSYIRGSDFKKVEDNLYKMLSLKNLVECEVTYAICNLNILNLDSYTSWFQNLVEKCNEMGIVKPSLSFARFVETPSYLSPWVLPEEILPLAVDEVTRVIQKIESSSVWLSSTARCLEPLKFIKDRANSISPEERKNLLDRFETYIKIFDKHRNMKFSFPDN